MYKHRFKALAAVSAVVLLFFLAPVQGYENKSHGSDPELNRAQLIAHMLRQQLPRHHYSHKEINDDLSQDSYDLFIKKLDPQKRFLLARDVEKLSAYSRKIDDEINLGQIGLPAVAASIFKERIPQIQKMVRELIGSINDFSKDESFETDPKNFGFCENSLNYGASYTQLNQIGVPAVHDLGNHAEGVVVGVFDNGFRLLTHQAFDSLTIIATLILLITK